jgi:hypothetical protein
MVITSINTVICILPQKLYAFYISITDFQVAYKPFTVIFIVLHTRARMATQVYCPGTMV